MVASHPRYSEVREDVQNTSQIGQVQPVCCHGVSPLLALSFEFSFPGAAPSSHLPPHPIPLGCPRALALSALFHVLNLYWSYILNMTTYMLQCYSLKSSHPCLLPHSPKVCSLYLCLFCCLAYRIIVTVFLNSIYMC